MQALEAGQHHGRAHVLQRENLSLQHSTPSGRWALLLRRALYSSLRELQLLIILCSSALVTVGKCWS